MQQCGLNPRTGLMIGAIATLTTSVAAVDLSPAGVVINQAVQFGSTTLVGNRSTMVRVLVNINGEPQPVPNVDAVLRVYADGVEIPGSPFFSQNGPITAPGGTSLADLDTTLNFLVLPPVSEDVDFVVTINPGGLVEETNMSNNTVQIQNREFECRDVMEVVYVPVNYTPGGGKPAESLTRPGIGDNFLRAIYSPSELNYHRSPLPTLTWTTNINASNSQLLNTLKDIRVSQIPDAGYPMPDYIYGWLPGNPFSGNGQANGIPGDAGFGNTQLVRFQRTFAHEIGHLIGLFHNNGSINTNGIDVEHHLLDTQNLDQLFPSNKKDIMVAGQITSAAFIRSASYNQFLNLTNQQCTGDAGAQSDVSSDMIRVSGAMNHGTHTVSFDPVFSIPQAPPTFDAPQGDVRIELMDEKGRLMLAQRVDTHATHEACSGDHHLLSTPYYAVLPATLGDQEVAAIRIVDVASGNVLAERARSANAPTNGFTAIEAVGDDPLAGANQDGPDVTGPMTGRIRISWESADADGDALTHHLLYSPNGGSAWLPLAVNLEGSSFEFDAAEVPASSGEARFRLRTSDGFRTVETEDLLPLGLGGGNPPEVYLITPNDGGQALQHASVLLHASAWDMEDQMFAGEQIAWSSSLDGDLGTGRELMVSSLTPGVHTLTVTGTDNDGMTGTDEIQLTVIPRSVVNPDLNGDGKVDGADLGALLSNWGGSGAGDLNFDGIVDGSDLGILLGSWT